jgi:hypothetical protein
MKKACAILVVSLAMLLQWRSIANAQIPVEMFVGHERTTLDIMFFKVFLDEENRHTPWLFFNRNRASIDYRMNSTSYLPQFGFTEALSYNHPLLKGFAPVAVLQMLNRSVTPKVGIQYATVSDTFTLFSWVVVEPRQAPSIDAFVLVRYTPHLGHGWRLFTQLELVNTFPTEQQSALSMVQRGRLGVQYRTFQCGLGADFAFTGAGLLVHTNNLGIFIRHEF